jgi:hypothetical protein
MVKKCHNYFLGGLPFTSDLGKEFLTFLEKLGKLQTLLKLSQKDLLMQWRATQLKLGTIYETIRQFSFPFALKVGIETTNFAPFPGSPVFKGIRSFSGDVTYRLPQVMKEEKENKETN